MCSKIAPQVYLTAWRNSLRHYALEHGADPRILKGYIEEIEWQDGLDYWRRFSTHAEFLEDFMIYAEVVTEDAVLVYDEEEVLA